MRSGEIDVDRTVGVLLQPLGAAADAAGNCCGDIGGFGARSQFSWNVLGALNYEIMKAPTYGISAYLG